MGIEFIFFLSKGISFFREKRLRSSFSLCSLALSSKRPTHREPSCFDLCSLSVVGASGSKVKARGKRASKAGLQFFKKKSREFFKCPTISRLACPLAALATAWLGELKIVSVLDE